jgi:hypothetical protein
MEITNPSIAMVRICTMCKHNFVAPNRYSTRVICQEHSLRECSSLYKRYYRQKIKDAQSMKQKAA